MIISKKKIAKLMYDIMISTCRQLGKNLSEKDKMRLYIKALQQNGIKVRKKNL